MAHCGRRSGRTLRAQPGGGHDRGRHAHRGQGRAWPRRHKPGCIPLWDRIADLPEPPTIALIYRTAEGIRDAMAECAGARIPTIIAVAEYVPVHDTLAAAALARAAGSWLVGPNTLGYSKWLAGGTA